MPPPRSAPVAATHPRLIFHLDDAGPLITKCCGHGASDYPHLGLRGNPVRRFKPKPGLPPQL